MQPGIHSFFVKTTAEAAAALAHMSFVPPPPQRGKGRPKKRPAPASDELVVEPSLPHPLPGGGGVPAAPANAAGGVAPLVNAPGAGVAPMAVDSGGGGGGGSALADGGDPRAVLRPQAPVPETVR